MEDMTPSEKDESGAYLIDRDPEYFRIVLNYLRDGYLHVDAILSLEGINAEAEFYCLDGLKALIKEKMDAEERETAKQKLRLQSEKKEDLDKLVATLKGVTFTIKDAPEPTWRGRTSSPRFGGGRIQQRFGGQQGPPPRHGLGWPARGRRN